MTAYTSIEQMVASAFEAMRPAERLTVTEAAQRYHIIRQPGAHSGPWSPAKTPYMVEVQDTLTSLDYTGVAFVGPARTGKSALFLNWLAHTAIIDPADMMIVHMSQNNARDWSKADLEKMFRHSPEIRRRLRPGRTNDNTFDKEFLSGMRLTVTWPTINNLSGKTIPRLWLMDYDRMPDDIDKEGNPFDLTKKRAQTFKRFGMTVAESSPGREVENPKWFAQTPHEAPPTKGILSIYNRGDRRRWYWHCPQCRTAFEATFSLFDYPKSADPMEAAEQVHMIAPCCGFPIPPSMKDELNSAGRWVKDNMILLPDGRIENRPGMRPSRSDIASFWLKGPAAGMQDWREMVATYIRAEAAYAATGDEEPLKASVNLDHGEPYTPKARISERLPEELKNKAEDWGSTEETPTVPLGVRFLLGTIDVQARAFVVQVVGMTDTGDMVIVDGFKIRKSTRRDSEGDPLTIDPASFAEDWDMLTDAVIRRSYPLADASGRMMQIKLVGCDSGGREGVTFQAYDYWRRLRAAGDGLHRRFALVKGDGSAQAPRAQVTWPDSTKKDRNAVARGDVPVVRFNSNLLKDQVSAMLGRRVAPDYEAGGGGMIRYPSWMPDWFYSQMTTEVRDAKGWQNPVHRRNEAWDLSYYAIGLAVRAQDNTCPLAHIGFDRIVWTKPPSWAAPWDSNDLVFWPDDGRRFEEPKKKARRSFADLGSDLA